VLGALTPLRPYYQRSKFARQLRDLQQRYQAAVDAKDEDAASFALGQLEELAKGTESPLERAERFVHPWVAVVVLPVFALANSGVMLSWDALRNSLYSPVVAGIVVGLVLGKFAGIFLFAWTAARLGWAALPDGITWRHMAGMSFVAGIGFTVSLFIAALSFTDKSTVSEAKIGILLASLISAVGGYLVLRFFSSRNLRNTV
jgi:NhaA family Na+:H+ antiporter